MEQFGTILKFELKNYFTNKIFVGVTAFLVVIIAAVMFFPRITSGFEANEPFPDSEYSEEWIFDDTEKEESLLDDEQLLDDDRPVMLISIAMERAEYVRNTFSGCFMNYNVRLTDDTPDEIKERIISGEAECAFVFDSLTSYVYYVNNLSMYDENTYVADEILQDVYYVNAMVESGLSVEQAEDILSVGIEHETESLGKDQMQNFFYTYIMIFALYMVILLYGQMVATNVAIEKSSRAMEVLITSAKPTAMMFGKVIASCLAGFVQLLCVFGSAFLFFNLNRFYWDDNMIVNSIFNMPANLLLYMFLFFILGFFIYAFMFGAVSSTASKLEDINTSVMPITILFIIAFCVVIFSMTSGNIDNILLVVCSYIPFTSPMAMFTRIAMGTVAWYEIVISVVILIGSVAGVGVLAARIYRMGVLLYGTTPKIGSVLKSIWRA